MMTTPSVWLRALTTDFRIGLLFCTRLPLANSIPIKGADIARASWVVPIAGALVGLLGALVYWLAHELGLSAWPAAALALAATMAATGCLHEDGLADTADGFGGGANRERKLEIMRDSRIGTYGTCALTMSLLIRWSALASLADPTLVASALIAAHASARATIPTLMWLLPPARANGLSADAGRPPRESAIIAGLLGTIVLGLSLGPMLALIALILVLLAGGSLAWLCMKHIGGQTGDALGAVEQVSETLILLTAAARF
jgi:adenosylcobinamide-GDP ribazoletransferase